MVDDHHVCLIENQRYAVGKTLLEVPAGTIDPAETAEQTAQRELVEETGYRAARIRPIREWYVSPGVMNERMHLFLCEDLEPGPADHQPGERIVKVIVPWAEAIAMVDDGRIEDAKSMLALTILDRIRTR
jgi:ADP-ribose pyrophosphatase